MPVCRHPCWVSPLRSTNKSLLLTPRFLDSQKSETHEPIDIKLDRGDYVEDLTPHANFGISTLKGGEYAYT